MKLDGLSKCDMWYTTDEKFPELGDEIVYLDKVDKTVKKITYQTDWINKHKKHVDICFKAKCLKWCLASEYNEDELI